MDWNNLFITWYQWLSALNIAISEPIRALSDGLGIPFVSAFLFGLLGTTAPCQLSTNFGALAFLARRPSERAATLRATLAFIGAKVLVYTIMGALVLTLGRTALNAVGPYLDIPRKIVGPLMIVVGLAVLGVLRVRWQFGQGLARKLERTAAADMGAGERVPLNVRPVYYVRSVSDPQPVTPFVAARATSSPDGAMGAGSSGGSGGVSRSRSGSTSGSGSLDASSGAPVSVPHVWSSFLLGAGFSLAFCPTLLLLFFGATLGLAARSTGGFTFPAFFALGTAIPLILFVGFAMTSAKAAERLRRGMRRANKPLRWVGGVILILLGLHDTLIYWFL